MKSHSAIDDPTLASRYLADQLSEAQCAEYEASFTQDPEAVAELEATARLKIGLERLRRDGELGELVAGSGLASVNRTWMFAMAASVIAVVIGASVWLSHPLPLPTPMLAATAAAFKDRSGHTLSVLATTPLFRTRADKYDAVIQLPENRGAIRLRVLPTIPSESAHYQASLSRMSEADTAERIVSIDNLQASADDGFVDLYADSSLLVPGRYRLILMRVAAGGSAAGDGDTFVIKVTPSQR